MGWQWSC